MVCMSMCVDSCGGAHAAGEGSIRAPGDTGYHRLHRLVIPGIRGEFRSVRPRCDQRAGARVGGADGGIRLSGKLMRSALLLAASCVIGILCMEIAWLALGPGSASEDNRYVLFAQGGGGPVFRNLDGFFTYRPGATISTAAYYATATGWFREYSYSYRTNSAGLVQSADIEPGRPALLLLGDSFTEGQGAVP